MDIYDIENTTNKLNELLNKKNRTDELTINVINELKKYKFDLYYEYKYQQICNIIFNKYINNNYLDYINKYFTTDKYKNDYNSIINFNSYIKGDFITIQNYNKNKIDINESKLNDIVYSKEDFIKVYNICTVFFAIITIFNLILFFEEIYYNNIMNK